MLKFEKVLKQTRILSPLKDFEEDTLTFEYRTDPLNRPQHHCYKGDARLCGQILNVRLGTR